MSYKRLTKWETSKGVKCVKYWQYSQEQIAERLALLEDKIENGTLVPKYSVVESCGTYYVCSVDTENLPVIDECETEEEAQKKLEELSKNP